MFALHNTKCATQFWLVLSALPLNFAFISIFQASVCFYFVYCYKLELEIPAVCKHIQSSLSYLNHGFFCDFTFFSSAPPPSFSLSLTIFLVRSISSIALSHSSSSPSAHPSQHLFSSSQRMWHMFGINASLFESNALNPFRISINWYHYIASLTVNILKYISTATASTHHSFIFESIVNIEYMCIFNERERMHQHWIVCQHDSTKRRIQHNNFVLWMCVWRFFFHLLYQVVIRQCSVAIWFSVLLHFNRFVLFSCGLLSLSLSL